MASSKWKHPTARLFDPIRKKWVEATAEEKVRQLLIHHMTQDLAYPLTLISVEKELFHLFPLTKKPPKRRADLMVFLPTEEATALMVLLLIECKLAPLKEVHKEQVIEYNTFIGAPFVAVATEKELLLGRYLFSEKRYLFQPGLPAFTDLLALLPNHCPQFIAESFGAIKMQHLDSNRL